MTEQNKGASGHRSRLRQRFEHDPHGLPAYELLELFLTCVLPRIDTKPLAKELLARFGNLAGILDALPAERLAVPGIGPAVETSFGLLREIIARYLQDDLRTKKAVTLYDIGQMIRGRLAGCPQEELWAALLDNGNRLLNFEKVCAGSVDQVRASPRDVVEVALKRKASGLVLAHNHPGGSGPSTLDVETTRRLRLAVEAVGIRFVDHLILRDGVVYSLTQEHLLV